MAEAKMAKEVKHEVKSWALFAAMRESARKRKHNMLQIEKR